jgi:hypothetical protein
MLKDRPRGWLNYMKKYVDADMIVPDLPEIGNVQSQMIGSVLLKNINYLVGQNYFIRPGQHLGETKFRDCNYMQVYHHIKALKTVLKVNINNYMLKKLLLKPINFRGEYFLFDVMNQPEVKEKFQFKIDYTKWEGHMDRNIPLLKVSL